MFRPHGPVVSHILFWARPPAIEPSLTPSLQGKNVVSVKGGCLEGLDWRTAIHIWTKTAMVPIPECSESYSEDADSTDIDFSQKKLDHPDLILPDNGGGPSSGI